MDGDLYTANCCFFAGIDAAQAAAEWQADSHRHRAAPSPGPVRRLLNLAELGDGASVLAANPEAKKPERAIDKDIDSFMKNDCQAQKWMIIELSQLGTVESVRLTMKELYSSRVHTFRVLGRTTHPRKDGPDYTHTLGSAAWQLLGSFTAENRRGTQSFSLPQRSRVRYLLMMFDTHYGNEVMCALNALELKLDQGKVAKRLDSLGKRSTDVETLAALLQQQQAQFQAQLEGLSAKLDALAAAHAQAELLRELQQARHHAAGSGAGPLAGGAGSALGSGAHHHQQGAAHPEFEARGNEPAVCSQVCHSPAAASAVADSVLPLLYRPLYQWTVVAALAVTASLGLPFLLQPGQLSLPKVARLLVCCLAVVNGLLAVALSVWLVVLRGGGLLLPWLVTDLPLQQLVVIPAHRMLGNGSTWRP
eukprot:gene5861-6102_t